MVCSILLSAWFFVVLSSSPLVPPVQIGPFDTHQECEAMLVVFKGENVTACWEKASERRLLMGLGVPMQRAGPEPDEEGEES